MLSTSPLALGNVCEHIACVGTFKHAAEVQEGKQPPGMILIPVGRQGGGCTSKLRCKCPLNESARNSSHHLTLG